MTLQRIEQMAGHRGWKQGLLTAVVLAVLAARVPLLWSTGEFVAEDGWVFFADAWNQAFPGSLLVPYAGYFHLLPRLLAELWSGLAIAAQPQAYAATGLALNAAVLAVFYLPAFRRLVASDLVRALVVLLLALAPHAQNLGLLLGLHWYLAYGLCLALVAPAPATTAGNILLAIFIPVCVWSSPSTFVLAPFAVAGWWRQRDPANRLKFGVLVGSLAVVAAFALLMRLGQAERTEAFQIGDLLTALDRLVLRGWLGAGLLGPRHAAAIPPLLLDGFGLAVLVTLAVLLWQCRHRDFARPLAILLGAALGMLLLSLARTAYVAELATLTLPVHVRYLTAPTLLLYSCVGMLGAHLLTRAQLVAGLAVLAALQLVGLREQNHWARAATRFHLRDAVPAIEQFARQSGPASLYVPADVPYWGPVLEKGGGLVVPPEAGLARAIDAKQTRPGHYHSWLGQFTTPGPGNWIEHETRGRLQFTGVERGRVFFRDPSGRLLFTSPLLHPAFWQLEGLGQWTLLDGGSGKSSPQP
jgi:hypothetical protein